MTNQIVCMYIGLGAFCFCTLVVALALYLHTLWQRGDEEFVLFWGCSFATAILITLVVYI